MLYTDCMKSLRVLLAQLGFDETQAMLFTEISNTGPVTVLELSRTTGIKRTTVHFHIEQLLERGLLTEGVRRGRRVVTAVDLKKLSEIIDTQRQQVSALERSLEKVLQEASSAGTKEQSLGIQFSVEDGIQAVASVYHDALDSGEVYSYIDLVKIDGIDEVRMKLFQDIALRSSVYSYRELYYSRDAALPSYAKKMKPYRPFVFARTQVKLSGSVVGVVCFDQTTAFIVRDTEWKVVRLSQGMVTQLLMGLFDQLFSS